MKKLDNLHPPKWPMKLLSYLVKQAYLEEIEGDLNERFEDNLKHYSLRRSRRLYIIDTIKLLRPALFRRLSGDLRLNHYGILRNY